MNTGKVDIILVEDNPDDAELALHALKKNRIANSLIHLKDGEEALDYIFCRGQYEKRNISDLPKVILLDIKMPKVDGLEVLKRIKADPGIRTIPVVLLTSSKEEKDIVESYQLGANSYIVKPVNFDSFVKAVSDLGLYWMLLNHTPGQG
ncbi:two-component system response regulator [Niastella vici]|uniref:Two-component system response regulator n=1 Tax=Niastella vici TaxID=1703345 RepID=A0A1V9FP87_9BACT|nr:response regulator [Niastella vici]OQP60091.1 two-component system response regulator [Niastella vici]